MALDFNTLLTADQKRDLLQQRIQQFAVEAYQHELNRQIAITVNDEQSIANADTALAVLETAINVHEGELNGLS